MLITFSNQCDGITNNDQNNAEPIANGKNNVAIEVDDQERFIYDVFDNPPIPLTFGFALQVNGIYFF